MRRQAVFLDVDGTYANDRGLVPASARRAVVAARANGHRVFLCTGRSMVMLWEGITDAGFDGVIASSGGHVEVDGEVIGHRTVAVEDLRHAVDFFESHDTAFVLESTDGLYGSKDWPARLRRRFAEGVTDPATLAELHEGLHRFTTALVLEADLIRPDINKISFLDSPLSVDAVRVEFAGTFDVIAATVQRMGPNSGELSIPGVHKATGMELVLAHLGTSRADTIAYGDGFNDIEMLQFAHTGIAMAGAHSQVKAVADGVTGAPDDDGIATSFAALGLI